jgi:hypothetical protein
MPEFREIITGHLEARADMLTREEFDRRRSALKLVARRESRALAVFSVGLGVAQLLFLRWAEPLMAHDAVIAMAGSLFLAYMVGGGPCSGG